VGDLEQIAVFTVNSDNDKMVIQDEQKASGKALGMMLPYFITILLFAGAMGIGTDMIAGEKERGTMASLLVAPIKRSSIVLGKVFALMALSGISSVIYVGAMVAFMPLMSKSMLGTSGENLNISLNANQIAMLVFIFYDDCTYFGVCKDNQRGDYLCNAALYGSACCRFDDDVHYRKHRWKDVLYSGL